MKLATKKRSTMKFFKQACYACALSLMLLLAAQARVFAQGSAAAPDPNQSNRKQPNPNEPKLDAAPSRSRGPGQQLVHQSNEAAGEEKDEMEEFKHSSSVKAIARLTGLGLQQSYWLSVVVNFAVIAVGIGWAAKKYLPGMFRDRTAAIQKAMQEAQKASAEAQQKLKEIEARLARIDAEIGAMRAHAEKEGAAEEARLHAAAQEDAHKIVAAAEQEISAAGKAARRLLTAHAADLAVGLAQKQIHLDAPTDQALVKNFSAQLGASQNSGKDGY
jgi:F-type H+-transporting ATPase subunit b